jgi:hypothetical protein
MATFAWRTVILQAVAAGLVAGTVILLYLAATGIPDHNIAHFLNWIPTVAFGDNALPGGPLLLIGAVMHYLVSIGWAGGYAYLAQSQTFLNKRWAISGFFYGIVVYMFMNLLLIGARKFTWPATPLDWVNGIVTVSVFFGVPVALVIARMDRKQTA